MISVSVSVGVRCWVEWECCVGESFVRVVKGRGG